MNTKLLKYAVELSSLGSAQKVAAEFGISRSSVSRNIHRLEEEIGSPLFIKLQGNITPTYVGDIFLRYAREILKIEENLRFDLTSEVVSYGTVNIGMGSSRTQAILTDVLPQFSRKYPNITVKLHEMNTADIIDAILSQRLDFAVVSKTINADGITFEPLVREELVLVAPENDEYARTHCRTVNGKQYVDFRDFKDKTFILGHPGQKSRTVANAMFAKEGASPNIVFQAENCYTLSMMANKGLAYALVPLSGTRINSMQIPHYHICSEVNVTWYVGITYLSKHSMSRAAAQLKDMMLQILKTE